MSGPAADMGARYSTPAPRLPFAAAPAQTSAPMPRIPPIVFVAVFDFDLTLTKAHVWGTFRNAPLDQVPIDADTFVDLDGFRDFVADARRRDADVAIATFGRRDVVDKAMRFALGDSHGVEISTPADHYDPRFKDVPFAERPMCPEGSDVLGNKNTQLANICLRFGVDASRVVLADDDANNVAAAREAGISAEHASSGCDKQLLLAMMRHVEKHAA
ncbi:hypothetical protein M885DRAFT_545268 [Pelagophyceae sp. CCMP2097]|nr:hypothetical protein M885DRAFT_545268 [Pelagophyceae sp. CCMP2097]|mmetsp:Transcript_3590/g.10888  ORF Transcript_3590/g.10888 Transcript_3590/m.10888 type:complete len:216 (+) Transcript_3590:33-680(+)